MSNKHSRESNTDSFTVKKRSGHDWAYNPRYKAYCAVADLFGAHKPYKRSNDAYCA